MVSFPLVLSRDEKRVFSGSDDNTVKIFDLVTMECTATLTDHEESINTLAMCDNGRFFVSGSEDLTIRVWNIERQECTKVLRGHEDWINGIAISSDGRRLVGGDLDGCIKVWDLETGWCIRTLKGHTSEVWDVALSSDVQWLYSCSEDATIRGVGFGKRGRHHDAGGKTQEVTRPFLSHCRRTAARWSALLRMRRP